MRAKGLTRIRAVFKKVHAAFRGFFTDLPRAFARLRAQTRTRGVWVGARRIAPFELDDHLPRLARRAARRRTAPLYFFAVRATDM
jgi:hypothetical protein